METLSLTERIQNMDRFDGHNHTMYSNIRLLDCINKPKDLIDYAVKIGLKGIAITDHECLSGAIKVNKYVEEIRKAHPDFKVGLGNEIYLCKDRKKKQKYYHFILIAKNKDGFRALRELSSRAWLNSYIDRGLERVVTTYDDLTEIVKKYPKTLIAQTACLGSQVATQTLRLIDAEQRKDADVIESAHEDIINFILYCKELFEDDFYLEIAPSQSKEQILFNRRAMSIAKTFNLKMVIGSDAHMLKKEDRFIHEAYLNSKGGERETASFYEYAYLHSNEECIKDLKPSGVDFELLCKNSMEIYDKIENYSLHRKPVVPKVDVKYYEKKIDVVDENKYPTLSYLFKSEDIQERYWVNQCYDSLLEKENNKEIKKNKHDIYMERLETEGKVIKIVSEKLEDCMYSYFNTFQHYIELFWECGSVVGPNRGSSACFLSNYLLGIVQLDAIEEEFYYWRFMNEERTDELPDID